MKDRQSLLQLVLRAVALAIAAAVIVLGVLGILPPKSNVILVGFGLAVLAVASLSRTEE
jgi:flagellar biosynthesis component FlhA